MKIDKFVFLTCAFLVGSPSSALYAQDTQRVQSKDGSFSMICPAEWVVRTDFENNTVKLQLVSPLDNKKDIFKENILVLGDLLVENETLENFINQVNNAERDMRPDFTIMEDSSVIIDGQEGRRLVARITFPEFVSKNIQYFVQKGNIVYTMTASIAEIEFENWQKQIDAVCLTAKFE